ncbi:ADP-ribosylglycohydrolase family protein [Streptomyces albipurpureus]|uniref:ADP-ribosylglycohydrolase family protein n=1 Tax=Streptomyces albipurpureus TaxID=2897419 RepID=A0ABT0UQG8_9ACTN|nr:ADP-ribosylglycohydrolase family protein [Streptomyces sp. CWNU-1]MCM2390768.1 ADP-ribosylglycohydrolase family protein [Streptomyces sp. CWNU-1]
MPPSTAGGTPSQPGNGLRVTWVQAEDLIGHELRQAAEDGRDVRVIAARWEAAGGPPPPSMAGASPAPASAELRALALLLLDELAAVPTPFAAQEPTDLPTIKALCPDWPADSDPRSASAGEGPSVQPRSPDASRSVGGLAEGHSRRGSLSDIDALHAAWLGRAAGCLLGKPVEKLPLHAIRAIAKATGNWPLTSWFTAQGLPAELSRAHPWNRRSAGTSLAENIDGMPEDDDLNFPLLNLLLLQRYGRDFQAGDVARLWLDELPAGRTFTAERIAYRNLLSGIEPPATAQYHNPFREWIGAAIRADVHGWTNPGAPGAAAAQAQRDASLTHTASGVHSAMFIAAAIAAAAEPDGDVHRALAVGLSVVPPTSRLARAVRAAISLAAAEADFDKVVDRLHTAHAHYHWVHAVPNAALLAAALTHADGDFTGSICRAVSGGWDTDSNGATAGSLAGLLARRPDALPDRWTAPLKNRLSTSVAAFDGIGFDTLAQLTHQEALRP